MREVERLQPERAVGGSRRAPRPFGRSRSALGILRTRRRRGRRRGGSRRAGLVGRAETEFGAGTGAHGSCARARGCLRSHTSWFQARAPAPRSSSDRCRSIAARRSTSCTATCRRRARPASTCRATTTQIAPCGARSRDRSSARTSSLGSVSATADHVVPDRAACRSQAATNYVMALARLALEGEVVEVPERAVGVGRAWYVNMRQTAPRRAPQPGT